MRDPRAVAVSSYYHIRQHPDSYLTNYAQDHSLDDAVLHSLPYVCQWIALRHILFGGLLADSSEIFWYDDALEHPQDWHYRWSYIAGLILPKSLMGEITALAGQGSWGTEINTHVGGKNVSFVLRV